MADDGLRDLITNHFNDQLGYAQRLHTLLFQEEHLNPAREGYQGRKYAIETELSAVRQHIKDEDGTVEHEILKIADRENWNEETIVSRVNEVWHELRRHAHAQAGHKDPVVAMYLPPNLVTHNPLQPVHVKRTRRRTT
ncbi:hypothetical protein JCM10212_000149 [Sporobolomyces blumeae]